eukprot:6230240-Prymnesium_polylepis.1
MLCGATRCLVVRDGSWCHTMPCGATRWSVMRPQEFERCPVPLSEVAKSQQRVVELVDEVRACRGA